MYMHGEGIEELDLWFVTMRTLGGAISTLSFYTTGLCFCYVLMPIIHPLSLFLCESLNRLWIVPTHTHRASLVSLYSFTNGDYSQLMGPVSLRCMLRGLITSILMLIIYLTKIKMSCVIGTQNYIHKLWHFSYQPLIMLAFYYYYYFLSFSTNLKCVQECTSTSCIQQTFPDQSTVLCYYWAKDWLLLSGFGVMLLAQVKLW